MVASPRPAPKLSIYYNTENGEVSKELLVVSKRFNALLQKYNVMSSRRRLHATKEPTNGQGQDCQYMNHCTAEP